jgi:Rieske Fe-S protein
MQEPHTPDRPLRARRAFLLLLPFGVLGGAVASVAVAALRFLRPAGPPEEAGWHDLGPVADAASGKPTLRRLAIAHTIGWATATEEHSIYVLTAQPPRVLTGRCPHEGCEVNWQEDSNHFVCPCHDSSFSPDGARLSGPARRGLDQLPARVQNGVLQVQYQFFENNTEERVQRG